MSLLKDLQGLNAAYAEVHASMQEDQDKGYVVTAADKKGNTKAWQGYKSGVKSKTTGKPLYRAADHLKKEEANRESQLWDQVAANLTELHELRGVKYKVVPFNEHHQKDASGKVIEHGDGTPSSLDEDKKKKNIKAAKAGKRWQDNDGDGKWYEPGVDVKKESVGSAIDKTLSAAGEVADTAIKLPAKAVGYAKGLKKGLKKASKEGEDKAASSSSPKEEMELLNKLVESGQFTQEEIDAIVEADRLGKLEEARRADKMGIARKKVTYDKGNETRNPNPDRGPAPTHKPEGGSLAGSKAKSRARSLGDARRKANRKGANLAYGDREGRLADFAATKRQSDSDLGSQKAATDTGAHKGKGGWRQNWKHGERGDKRRPQQNPKHTANK